LAPKLLEENLERNGREMMVQKVGEALDAYVKERRMRLVWLSTQTYLTGKLLLDDSPLPMKLLSLVIVVLCLETQLVIVDMIVAAFKTNFHAWIAILLL
jgi:hypothetical protein